MVNENDCANANANAAWSTTWKRLVDDDVTMTDHDHCLVNVVANSFLCANATICAFYSFVSWRDDDDVTNDWWARVFDDCDHCNRSSQCHMVPHCLWTTRAHMDDDRYDFDCSTTTNDNYPRCS
jgi:hypothetical protein